MQSKSIGKDWRYISVDSQLGPVQESLTTGRIARVSAFASLASDARLWKLSAVGRGKNKLTPRELQPRELIFGDDDRVQADSQIYPYKSICLLLITDKYNQEYYGTGFFISKKCVITAGHCVFFKNDWAKEITVVPAAQGMSKPYGSITSNRFKSVAGWTNAGNENFDHGAVILDNNSLFEQVASAIPYQADINDNDIEISGYPVDKDRFQWKSNGGIIRRSKFRVYYELDTLRGNSGSPILVKRGDRFFAIGVHTQGQDPNYGIRINPEIISRWAEWSNL